MPVENEVKATIRTVRIDDATEVLTIHRDVIGEGEFFIYVPEEFDKTPDQQREWIQKILDNERDTMIVAEMNGQVVGWIVFLSQTRMRLSHTGSFGLMIKKEHRNIGIGKLLLKELLAWAEQNPLIEKVSLGVFSTNLRAITLYKKMGFVEEGRKVSEFKLNDNEYLDDILMYKFV